MKVAILLFDGFTFLDVIGPYEVLARMPDAHIYVCAVEKKVYKDSYGKGMVAEHSIDDITDADVLLVPGGYGIDEALKDKHILQWIKRIDRTSQWTTSVCSGSLLLAEAGLINQKNVTTHWKRKDQLRRYDLNVVDERYVHDGKFITSAGVSAGIDMALYLVSQISGEAVAKKIQGSIEYDPMPPFKFEL